MPLGISLAVVVAVVALLAHALLVRRRAEALSRVSVAGGDVVVDVLAPVWLCFRRRLVAPLSAVTAVRAVPAGTRVPLTLRLGGTGLPGLNLGYFWQRGAGVCFVVRRTSRDAVEVDVAGRRVRGWIVEVPSAGDAVAAVEAGRAGAPR